MKGIIILLLEKSPTKITYKVVCDRHWRTKTVDVNQERDGETGRLRLTVDRNQQWLEKKISLPFATGLFDVDFEVTPATNTLPIRRLNLKIGESRELDAVWIRFPSLRLERLKQRYTRLTGRRYKYEAPGLDFEVQLEVDENGLILRYGKLWTRIA